MDGPDALTRSGAVRLAPPPARSCNSSCEMGEVGLRVLGLGLLLSQGGVHGGLLRGQADQAQAQISMSVILKPSTMLSMLRMKVSSFE